VRDAALKKTKKSRRWFAQVGRLKEVVKRM
jgi:hypothetical protein